MTARPFDPQAPAAGSPLPAAVHLVGIGGMHMSAIARILLAAGVRVSGSDQVRSPMTEAIARLGGRVAYGHAAAHLGDATLVVTTAAAKPDNPEVLEAARRGIPVISRAQMVARLMAGRVAVAVAGTHGKTTTSTMIAWLLHRAGRDPTYLLGGVSVDLGTNAAPGGGAEIVVEADEYARAFLEYRPHIAVVTNVEADHLEYYGSVAAYADAFRQFLERVPADGVIVACADSPRLMAQVAAATAAARVELYRVLSAAEDVPLPPPDWLARDVGPGALGGHDFTLAHRGRDLGRFSLRVPGVHMVANAVGAIAAGTALGLEPATMRDALAAFHGVRRRFEVLGEARGVVVVDDFAHHPTEVRATLRAARERFPARRLVAVFQPHTYSRTAYLLDEFRDCFVNADRLFVLETYGARETPDAGVAAQDLVEAVKAPPCEYVRTAEDAADRLRTELKTGDVLVTIGAGDVDRVGRAVLESLRVP